MSYSEYVNKLSELEQTIVGGSSTDNIEMLTDMERNDIC